MSTPEIACPGCGLVMPRSDSARYDGGYNTSAECWGVYAEVLAREYGDALLFGRVHQLTVDSYAAQHAGGNHRDKSVVIHLSGLHLMLDRGLRPTEVPPRFQRLAATVKDWPHLTPPATPPTLTVFDVALAESGPEHARLVREWAESVWASWRPQHDRIRRFVDEHLGLIEP